MAHGGEGAGMAAFGGGSGCPGKHLTTPHSGPVVAWPLPLLSQGSDCIGPERMHVPAETRPIARRRIRSVKSLSGWGEWES